MNHQTLVSFLDGVFGSTKYQGVINILTGIVGAIITFAFGGWSDLLGFFLLAIVIDYATGIAASLKEGKGLNSEVGFNGLFKKAAMLLLVMLAYKMDGLMGTAVIRDGAIYFYLANELISITENYGRLGLPLPNAVRSIIEVLKDKGGNDPNAN